MLHSVSVFLQAEQATGGEQATGAEQVARCGGGSVSYRRSKSHSRSFLRGKNFRTFCNLDLKKNEIKFQ